MSESKPSKSNASKPEDEILKLASRQCDGTISPGEKEQLEGLLLHHPHLRRRYLSMLGVHADLMWMYRTGDPTADVPAQEKTGAAPVADNEMVVSRPNREYNSGGRLQTRYWYGLAGVVTTALAFLFLMRLVGGRPESDPVETTAENERVKVTAKSKDFVATLLGSSALIWTEEGRAIDVGERVPAATVEMEAGESEWLFDSGAKLVLSGPARMELKSPLAASLDVGTLVAHMPESAVGFQLKTGSADLVDQGTEFGVMVHPDGATEVHVFQGQVDVQGNDVSPSVELFDGQAMRLDSRTQPGTAIEFSRAGFAGLDRRIAAPQRWPSEQGGNDHYYQLVVCKTPISWHDAARDAMARFHQGMPGHLATVTSAAEDAFLTDTVIDGSVNRGIWIGLTDVLKESQFSWITGEPVAYTNWASFPAQQPDNYQEADWHGGEDYGMYTTFPNRQAWAWNDLSVDSIHEKVSAYLVEYEAPVAALKNRSFAGQPVRWEVANGGNGHHYQLVLSLESVAWEVVEERAREATWNDSQGHLATLESMAEQDFVIKNLLQTSGVSENLIGLTGGDDSDLQWITNQPFDRSDFGKPFLPTEKVYGLLFWDGRKAEWSIQTRAEDALPAAWFGYVIEYP